jgi:hypothetical protein
MKEAPDQVIINSERASIVVASVGRVIVLINGGEMAVADVVALRKAFERVTSRGHILGRLTVLEPTAALRPPADIRARVIGVIATFQHLVAWTAIVYERTRFNATAVRSVATAIHLASRSTSRQRTFARLSEACTWLTQSLALGAPTDASGFTELVEQLRVRARKTTLSPPVIGHQS